MMISGPRNRHYDSADILGPEIFNMRWFLSQEIVKKLWFMSPENFIMTKRTYEEVFAWFCLVLSLRSVSVSSIWVMRGLFCLLKTIREPFIILNTFLYPDELLLTKIHIIMRELRERYTINLSYWSAVKSTCPLLSVQVYSPNMFTLLNRQPGRL